MNKIKWKTYAVWILLTEAVGVLSGLLSAGGTRIFQETVKNDFTNAKKMIDKRRNIGTVNNYLVGIFNQIFLE